MMACPTTSVTVDPLSISDKLSFAWRIPLLSKCYHRVPICVLHCVLRCRILISLCMVVRFTAAFASSCLSYHANSMLKWRQKLVIAYLQAFKATFTRKQCDQSRKLLTGPRIQEYCRKHSLKHRAVSLDDVAISSKHEAPTPILHFVTAPLAQPGGPTILYSHGGGYHHPIREEGHMPFALHCAAACQAQQVVFLEYSLSPEQQYPCQLVQAVASLRFLLEQEGIPAENIILGGDSAGGHLTASLLTHIIQPSPYACPLDLRGGQFKALVLVSPWMAMSEEQIRSLPQAPGDYLTRDDLFQFWEMFNPGFNEEWSNQCEIQDAVTVWRKLFPVGRERAICRRAILAVGTSEVLLTLAWALDGTALDVKTSVSTFNQALIW